MLDEVDWHTISKDKPEAWLYFYEDFLEVYDNTLRKRTGSYYTPPEVVSAMVHLVDEALARPAVRTARRASPPSDVIVADPAVGTGTFLLGVLRRIAADRRGGSGRGRGARRDRGGGETHHRLRAAVRPVRGGAASADRRIAGADAASRRLPELRLFITDTLGNPFIEEERSGRPMSRSRSRGARRTRSRKRSGSRS